MTCPDPLPRNHAKIIRYKIYEHLIKKYLDKEIEWSDKALKPLRDKIRHSIRDSQKQTCYYCRRPISIERRNIGEAIEHFLDKSKPYYRKWAFHPLNLVIACQPCNMEKSTKELGDKNMQNAKHLLPSAGDFRWPHPYFDSYDSNIEIAPGPIYSAILGAPKQQAYNMINELKLDSLPNIDDRIHKSALDIQKLQNRMYRLVIKPTQEFISPRRLKLANEIKARLDRAMFEIFKI